MLIQLFEHSQSHGYPEGLKRKMTGVLAFFLMENLERWL